MQKIKLNGHSTMQLLPADTRDWFIPKDFYLHNYFNDCPISCFLKVNLDYPDELQWVNLSASG